MAEWNNFTQPPCCELEKWKQVLGYGLYAVSTCGRVISLRTNHKRPFGLLKGTLVNGYPHVTLFTVEGTKPVRFGVHQLVLNEFVGLCPAGLEARHLDGVRTNAHLSNLKWGTSVENAEDRRRHGTLLIGEKNCSAKITEQEVLIIRELWAAGFTQQEIAEHCSLAPRTISSVARGKSWSHLPNAQPPRQVKGDRNVSRAAASN